MENRRNVKLSTERLVMMAMLTALTAVLAYFGGFIKIGSLASVNLTLIPVVLGAALLGPLAGAWLGFVSGAVFFLTADAVFWLSLSIPGTIVTVLIKGTAAGFFAGLAYHYFSEFNRYVAVIVAAIVAPLVNTGIFLNGCLFFFMDAVNAGAEAESLSIGAYVILFFVGLNFVFEVLFNVVLAPTLCRLIDLRQKPVRKPSCETPIEETPIEETPIEETPIEETPIEETPIEEAVSEVFEEKSE